MTGKDWNNRMDEFLSDLESIKKALLSGKLMFQLKAIYKVVDEKMFDDDVIDMLADAGTCLNAKSYQVMGTYMLGHFCIAALYEIASEEAINKYKLIYQELSEEDKENVDKLIKTKSLYLNTE